MSEFKLVCSVVERFMLPILAVFVAMIFLGAAGDNTAPRTVDFQRVDHGSAVESAHTSQH